MALRNPRPVLIVLTSLVVLGVFFWTPSFGIGPIYGRNPLNLQGSLATRLHEEEMRYRATLKAREGLIKKHGPTKEQIKA